MDTIRDDLLAILELSNQSPSFTYWNSLLDYFNRYRSELDLEEISILAFESERCRKQVNKRLEEKIDQLEVNPDIQTYLDKLEKETYKIDEAVAAQLNKK